MGKKYIIELLDECNSEFKGIMVFGLTQEKQISVELIPEESLTPYTEPDMEQVRKEAYEDGYKTAKVQCNIQAEKDIREGRRTAYTCVKCIEDWLEESGQVDEAEEEDGLQNMAQAKRE